MRAALRSLAFVALAWCTGYAAAGGWALLPSLLEPRQEIAGAWVGADAVVVGGFGLDRGVLDSAEAWQPGASGWSPLPPLPVAVHHPAAAVVDGVLIVVGGFTASGALHGATDAVQLFDPATGAWRLGSPMARARGGLAAATLEGRLIAVGGSDDHGTALGDVAAYDPHLDAWAELAPLPTPRDHLAAAAVGGRLHVVGGRARGAFTLDVHEVYDPGADAWSAEAPMPTGRSGHALAAVGGCLVALGGEGNRSRPDGLFDEVELFDPAARVWSALAPMPRPRHGMAALAFANRIVVVGGADIAGFAAVGTVDGLGALPVCGP
jgi:N-acetylneuraminic acid mutarotase